MCHISYALFPDFVPYFSQDHHHSERKLSLQHNLPTNQLSFIPSNCICPIDRTGLSVTNFTWNNFNWLNSFCIFLNESNRTNQTLCMFLNESNRTNQTCCESLESLFSMESTRVGIKLFNTQDFYLNINSQKQRQRSTAHTSVQLPQYILFYVCI